MVDLNEQIELSNNVKAFEYDYLHTWKEFIKVFYDLQTKINSRN
jgi:hypothetical protein